jgi:hypothetical protein
MKTKLFHSILTAVIALFLATPLLHAKKVEFPEKDPAFTFTMPDGWSTETGKDGRIYCTAPDGFKIGLVASPGVSDADDAKALLPKILKGMADAMKCESYKQDEAHTGDMGKLWLASMQAHCTSEGTEMSLNALVFSVAPGKYFSIVGAAPAKLDKAHDKDMNELIKSITPVE